MKNTLVIAQRELTERRFVIVSATAFALLALLVPFMPGVQAGERRGALVVASFILAVNFTAGLAAILGASILGRELSDGRLSFYFSKPLSSHAVWFGKLIAAALLIVVCFAIIAIPGLLAGGASRIVQIWTNPPREAPEAIVVFLAFCAALFLISHVIGTFVRSRSAWFAFDFIAAAICGTAIWLLLRPLLAGFALELIKTLGLILAIYAGVAIIGAGAWQVARGRTDRRRSHMELSRFLWIALGCGLLAMSVVVMWIVNVPLTGVRPEHVQQSSNGSWAVIAGKARNRGDYHAGFLYNVSDGRTVRIGAPWDVSFSADGKTASWVVPSTGASDVYIAKLDAKEPRPIATGLSLNNEQSVLSPDGSRLASVSSGGILTVYNLATNAALGSVRIKEGGWWHPAFVTSDRIRVYAGQRQMLKIYEFDVTTKTLDMTGEMPVGARFTPDYLRALLYWNRPALEVRDARTGTVLTSIPGHFVTATFLSDGRIATVEDSVVRVFTSTGAPIREIPLQQKADRFFVTEAGPGLVAVAVRNPAENLDSTAIVDVNRGVVTHVEPGLHPVNRTTSSTLLCVSREGLVVWNPATGEKRVVASKP